MKARRGALAGLFVALVAVATMGASCQTAPTQDRGGANCAGASAAADCAPVDEVRDVDYVLIERNANDAPNLVISCVAGLGYTSGSTGRAEGDGGTAGGAQIVRDTSWDPLCQAHRKQTVTGKP